MNHWKSLALPFGLALAAGAFHWMSLQAERSKFHEKMKPKSYYVYTEKINDIDMSQTIDKKDLMTYFEEKKIAMDQDLPGFTQADDMGKFIPGRKLVRKVKAGQLVMAEDFLDPPPKSENQK